MLLQWLEHVPVPDWSLAAAVLGPAIAMATPTADELRGHVERREFACWKLDGIATGYALTSIGPAKDGPKCLWVKYAAGRLSGGPKTRRAALRWIVGAFEALAEDAGCTEVRIEGRPQWAAIFSDYSVHGHGDGTVHLRKVLADA